MVAAIGPQVSSRFSIGDRVALEVGVPCDQCGMCRKGRYNLCKKMRFRSSAKSFPHFQGTLQERINHPAEWCHKSAPPPPPGSPNAPAHHTISSSLTNQPPQRLPDHISFASAALLEPLSVAIHALNRGRPAPGATALVLGAGAVGLLTAAMARQAGCTAVTICDVDQGRVDYALAHGFASHGYIVPRALHTSASSASVDSSTDGVGGAVTPASSSSSAGSVYDDAVTLDSRLESANSLALEILAVAKTAPFAEQGGEEDEDEGVDLAFECTGKETCMHTALYATKPGGKVIMVGMGTPIQTLPMSVAQLREVDILGIFRYANTYATGIRLLSASKQCSGKGGGAIGALPSLDNMITHRFKGLHRALEAFELAGRTVDDEGRLVLKVIIEA